MIDLKELENTTVPGAVKKALKELNEAVSTNEKSLELKLFKAAALLDEDSSLGELSISTNGNTEAAYDLTCINNPDVFRWNGHLNLYNYQGLGVQPDQVHKKGASTGENTARGFDTVNVQVAVCTDAPEITYRILNTGTDYCIKIEEQGEPAKFINKTPTELSGGGYQSLNLVLGSRKRRIITLCAPRGSGFVLQSVRATGADTFWALPKSKKVAFIADSFGVGLNLNAGGQYWCDIVSDAFGWDNYLPSCVSGTGFINKSGSGFYNFIERLPQIITWNPEKVVVNISVNDVSYTEDEVKTATTNFIDTLSGALPNVEIIIIGALGKNLAEYKALEEYAKSAIDESSYDNIKFIPVQTETTYMNGWINGSGSSTEPAGNGNADIYLQADKLHPTKEGQIYLASRIIQGMITQGVRH